MSSQEDNESSGDHYNPSSIPSLDMQIEIRNKKNLYRKNSMSSQQGMNEDSDDSQGSFSDQSSGSDYMRNITMNNKERFRGRRPNPAGRNIQSVRARSRGRGRGRGGMVNYLSHKNMEEEEKRKIDEIFLESQGQDELGHKNNRSDSSDDGINIFDPKKNKKEEEDSDEDKQDDKYDSEQQQKQQMLQSLKQKQQPAFASSDSQQSDLSEVEQEQQVPKSHFSDKKQSNPIKFEDAKSDHLILDESLMQNFDGQSNLDPAQIQRRKIAKEQKNRIKIYAENFAQYKIRRVMKYINGKVDVNIRYLHELVYDCYEEDLICQELMLGIKHMGLGNSYQFIQKYNDQKLSQFDFRKVKFTIFDHRRLVKLLKEKGTKKQYTDQKQLYFMPYELHVFMGEVYALPQDSYDALCYSMDEAYQLNWWKTIGTELKGKQPPKQVKKIQTEKQQSKKTSKKQTKRRKPQPKSNPIKNQEQPEQNKNKMIKDQQVAEDQQQKFRKLIQDDPSYNQSSVLLNSERRNPTTDKSSIFSSSVFDSQKLLNSDFSLDSNTHSLSGISDLIEEPKARKKKGKNTKEQLEEKQMDKVKKSAVILKKLEQGYKNPSKHKKTSNQPKKQSKTPRKKAPSAVKADKKVKKSQKKNAKKKQKSQVSECSQSRDIQNSSLTSKNQQNSDDSQSI